MNNRKTLRLESTDRTQGEAELDQLLAALDITEDTFNEWRQLMRAMRQIGPGAEKLTFDELCALAQRAAENYERVLVCNGRESDEDTEPFDLTDSEQTPTVLTIPVEQVRGILPNVHRRTGPAYLYSAAIVALLSGLILMIYTNQPFQHVDNNVRKETTTRSPSDAEPKVVLAKIEKVSQTTRPTHLRKDTTTTQEAEDTTPKTPITMVQQIVQERSTASSPTVVQPPAVLSSETPRDARSMEGIRSLKLRLGSFEFFLKSNECFLKSEANLKGSGVKPTASPSPSVTPEKSLNEKERSRGQNGV